MARTPDKVRALEQSVQVQNDCGLVTRMLTPKEARDIVPELDIDTVRAASFNPDDGVVFEKDLGPDTLDEFKKMERYNPDKTWTPVPEKQD